MKLFSRWAEDSDEADFIEVKRRISKLISYNKVDTLGCFQEEKIRPIRWFYNPLICSSSLTKKNFTIQVCRNESEAISNSTLNSNLFLILFGFLTIFSYSDLEMTKHTGDQCVKSIFNHQAEFYKVNFYLYS